MSERELEERIMLTKKQYLEIEAYMQEHFPHAILVHQKNRYFDDGNHSIKKMRNVLRVRSFRDSKEKELTYKVKGEDGDIEYNQNISYYWSYQIIKYSRLPNGQVKDELIKEGIDVNNLKMIIDLYTRRLFVKFDDHTLFLDGNIYNNIVDYNLEVESNISKKHAKEVILKYCELFNITYKEGYKGKSTRAFMSLKK